jgi:hypothetical protein
MGVLGNAEQNRTPNRRERETVRAQRTVVGKGRRGGGVRRGAVPGRIRQCRSNCHTFLHWLRRTAVDAGRNEGLIAALLRAQQAQDVSLPLACSARPTIRTAAGHGERVGWGDTRDRSLLRGAPRHRHTSNTTDERFYTALDTSSQEKKTLFR